MVEDKSLYLKKGDTLKNYKEICIFLEEPIKTGNSKISQLNNWSRYFNWEQEKNKYIITEIYETPLPKITDRQYDNEIKKILLDLFHNNGGQEVYFFTKRNLAQYLGMFNQNLNILSDKINNESLEQFLKTPSEQIKGYEEKEIKKELEKIITDCDDNIEIQKDETGNEIIVSKIPWEKDIINYVEYAKGRTYQLLSRNLGYLQRDFLIKWYNKEILVDVEHQMHIEATEEQEKEIMKIKNEALNSMGYNTTYFIYQRTDLREKFINIVNKNIKEKLGYDYSYSTIKIIFNSEHIRREYCRMNGLRYKELKEETKKEISTNITGREYIETKVELSEKIQNTVKKGLKNNLKRKIKEDIIQEEGKKKIRIAKERGEIKNNKDNKIGFGKKREKEKEKNKEKIKLIYDETKIMITDDYIEEKLEPIRIYAQERLNSNCIGENGEILKLSNQELEEIRNSAKGKIMNNNGIISRRKEKKEEYK